MTIPMTLICLVAFPIIAALIALLGYGHGASSQSIAIRVAYEIGWLVAGWLAAHAAARIKASTWRDSARLFWGFVVLACVGGGLAGAAWQIVAVLP